MHSLPGHAQSEQTSPSVFKKKPVPSYQSLRRLSLHVALYNVGSWLKPQSQLSESLELHLSASESTWYFQASLVGIPMHWPEETDDSVKVFAMRTWVWSLTPTWKMSPQSVPVIPTLGRQRRKKLDWSSSLAELLSSWLSERPCLKQCNKVTKQDSYSDFSFPHARTHTKRRVICWCVLWSRHKPY